MDRAKITARRDENIFFGFDASYIRDLTVPIDIGHTASGLTDIYVIPFQVLVQLNVCVIFMMEDASVTFPPWKLSPWYWDRYIFIIIIIFMYRIEPCLPM